MIPGSRRNLFKDQSFDERDNAGTKVFKWHASGALHAKEEVGWGGRAQVAIGKCEQDFKAFPKVLNIDVVNMKF